MNLLVTGGAGYIGSHFCLAASKKNHRIFVYDNLSTGHEQFVKFGPLIKGDLRETEKLKTTLIENKIDAVVHFAAKSLVAESVAHPELYFENNVEGTRSLLQAMKLAGTKKLVFSSSCATYGIQPQKISESAQQVPTNPYGESKLQCEKLVFDFQKNTGAHAACLRYFNVVGQDPENNLWEDHQPETHIVPNILLAEKEGRTFKIFGDTYETPDGSCIRDYVDVLDLADVHLAALSQLDSEELLISNVGSGRGYSVKEVLSAYNTSFNVEIPSKIHEKRPGDPPSLVADTSFFSQWYPTSLKPLEKSIVTLNQRRQVLLND